MASTLKSFRNGAVGFIDWLGSVLSIGFDDLCRASGNLDDEVPLDIHGLPVCGSVPLPVEAGAGCLGDKLDPIGVKPSDRTDCLRPDVQNLVLRRRWQEPGSFHAGRKLNLGNSSLLYLVDCCIPPVMTALEVDCDVMAVRAPQRGRVASSLSVYSTMTSSCPRRLKRSRLPMSIAMRSNETKLS